MHCTGKTLQMLLGVGGILLLLCLLQSNPGARAGEIHAKQLVCWSDGEAVSETSVMNSRGGHDSPIASQGQTACPKGYVPCGQRQQLCCPR
jgi:hypothetical protein